MNDHRSKEPKLFVDAKVILRSEAVCGRVEVPYVAGIGSRRFSLRIRSFVHCDRPEVVRLRETNRNPRRTYTLNEKKHHRLAAVSPKFECAKQHGQDSSEYFKGLQFTRKLRRKLNKVSVIVGKETTNLEEDNVILNIGRYSGLNFTDILNNNLLLAEFDLSDKLTRLLQCSEANRLTIYFDINMKNKLPCTMCRPIATNADFNFDNKREEMIQRVVYKRGKTILTATDHHRNRDFEKPLFDSTEEDKQDTVTIRNYLELLCDGEVIDCREIEVLDSPGIKNQSVLHTLTGSIPNGFRGFFCWRRRSYINYIFCLSDDKLWENRQSLSFTLRAQFSLLEHFSYLDFKLKETVQQNGTVVKDATVFGSCVHISRKKSSKADTPQTYFEFVGSISLLEFELSKHLGFSSPSLTISHRLCVYLSNWPYTFLHRVGEVSMQLSKIARVEQLMDLISVDDEIISPTKLTERLVFSMPG